ncbi:MAG: twin transmembrane helix small protein [Gammaproteobacteria bacterium]
MKLLILLIFAGILSSLGSAVYYLMKDRSGSMAQALTWRIGLSVGLFILLLVLWWLGLIQPHNV